MIIHDDEQGSEAWLQRRAGCITASRFKDAVDCTAKGAPSAKCQGYLAQVALERIAKRPVDRFFETWQMREGKEQEPLARIAYEAGGHFVTEAGLITTDDGVFGYSSDGLSGDDGALEIKTILSSDVAVNVLGRRDHSAYIHQCQGGLWVTGRAWIDLVLWCPALDSIGKAFTVRRIFRDEAFIEKLEADLLAFAARVKETEELLRQNAGN